MIDKMRSAGAVSVVMLTQDLSSASGTPASCSESRCPAGAVYPIRVGKGHPLTPENLRTGDAVQKQGRYLPLSAQAVREQLDVLKRTSAP
jgi:hypothetical protein